MENLVETDSPVYKTKIVCFNDYIYRASVEKNKLWDEEIVDEIIANYKEGTDVLDIGSNVGLIPLGLLVKSKKEIPNIHCFECHPEVCPVLYKNTSRFKNIKMYPFALSDTQELCQVSKLTFNMGCNHIFKSKNASEEIKFDYSTLFNVSGHHFDQNSFILGVPLDSLKYQFTNKISVIKIDVEGFELKVLKGAKEIISENRPVVIVEIFESINWNPVLEFFKELKYSTVRKIVNPNYSNQDYIFIP